jgi:hypothetical protein
LRGEFKREKGSGRLIFKVGKMKKNVPCPINNVK